MRKASFLSSNSGETEAMLAETEANQRLVQAKWERAKGLGGSETVIVEGWQKTRPGGKVKLAPEEKVAPYAAK